MNLDIVDIVDKINYYEVLKANMIEESYEQQKKRLDDYDAYEWQMKIKCVNDKIEELCAELNEKTST